MLQKKDSLCRRWAAFLAVFIISFTTAPTAAAYYEAPADLAAEAWYGAAAEYACAMGYLQPDEEGNFSPMKPVSMLECVAALAAESGVEARSAVQLWESIAELDWFSAEQIPLSHAGEPVTRYTATRLATAARRLPLDDVGNAPFSDFADMEPAVKPYVAAAYAAGIFTGDGHGRFNGDALLTRAEFSVMIYRMSGAKYRYVLSAFASPYDPAVAGRTENLRLAAAAVDGTELDPGDAFSFNQTVGRRTRQNGYQPGYVISGGRYVLQVGGGICQVSSNLFNNALCANFAITERYNHGLKVAYAPAGRDATVYWGSLDFRFQNSGDTAVLIRARLDVVTNRLTTAFLVQQPPQENSLSIRVTRQSATHYLLERFAGETLNYSAVSRYAR